MFCSYLCWVMVRWDKVPSHMHLPSVLARGERLARVAQEEAAAQEEGPRTAGGLAAAHRDALAQDKELMAIFERTYGPIQRDPGWPCRSPAKRETAQGLKLPWPRRASAEGPSTCWWTATT